MSVVADTSSLNYLLLLGHVDLLPAIYGEVVIPQTVMRELAHPRTADVVRRWVAAPPTWLELATVTRPIPDMGLHAGERDTIAPALERGIERVLLDDRRARMVASSLGLRVSGLLGVLDTAVARKWINLRLVLRELLGTSFRCRPELIRELLDRQERREREK